MKIPPRTKSRSGAGVCGGLAQAYGWDVRACRILFILTSWFSLPVYVALWMVMPAPRVDAE